VRPRPFRPVLRGLLLTGGPRTYLRAGPGGSAVATEPLWWPPAKIVGRHLAPFLAEQANLPVATVRPPGRHVAVDVDLAAGA
jgi:hypothetical protein